MTTPTPLQRLSEIVEAAGPFSPRTSQELSGELVTAGSRLARFLASPGAVEVLARSICEDRTWPGAWEKANDIERGHWRLDALASINTIAEQALMEPSHG